MKYLLPSFIKRHVAVLAMALPCLAQAASPQAVLGSPAMIKAAYDAVKTFPAVEGAAQMQGGGGTAELSAWQWHVIELNGAKAQQVMTKYLNQVRQSLLEAQVGVTGPNAPNKTLGLRIFTLKSPDGSVRGTISIAAHEISDTRFMIVVSCAVSPGPGEGKGNQ